MIKRNLLWVISLSILWIFSSGIALSQQPVKLAILPFKIYSSEDLTYLQQGLCVMLKSRLSLERHIEIVDIDKKASKELKDVNKLAKEFNLDYVLSGSLTMFGNSASIDLKLTNIEQKKVTPFFAECSSLNEVIPKIAKLSTDIIGTIIPSLKKEVARPSPVESPEKSEISPPIVPKIGKTLFYITFITKPNRPQTYHLFFSDKPQVKGGDPIVDEEDIEEPNFPEYRRAGEMETQGLDLGKVSVKEKTNFVFDVTGFIHDHPSKCYFLAVKREGADYFVPMETWFNRKGKVSGKTKIVFQTGILGSFLDQKFRIKEDTLEFSIKSPE